MGPPWRRVVVHLGCAEVTFGDGTSIDREFPLDGPSRLHLPVAGEGPDDDGSYAFVGPHEGDFDVVCFPEMRAPDARTVRANAASSSLDQDFLFELAEVDDGRW